MSAITKDWIKMILANFFGEKLPVLQERFGSIGVRDGLLLFDAMSRASETDARRVAVLWNNGKELLETAIKGIEETEELRAILKTLVQINERRADLPNEHPPEPHEIDAWKKATALAWNGGANP